MLKRSKNHKQSVNHKRRSKLRGGYYFYPSQNELKQSREALYKIFLENGADFDMFNPQFQKDLIDNHVAASFGPETGRKKALDDLKKLVQFSKT